MNAAVVQGFLDSPFVQVAALILKIIPHVLFNPGLAWIFWLMILLVVLQYRRAAALELRLYGRVKNPAWQRSLTAAGYGLLGGLLGSFMFVFVGAVLSQEDIMFVWPLALLLMAVNPRFICFSYAGGLVAVASLTFGWPPVNVPGLIALVAILHMVEGLLVALSGDDCATPVFVRQRSGRVVGGFSIQRFWPIPVVILLAMAVPEQLQAGGVEMPGWWPLIPPTKDAARAAGVVYTLFPVVAALGYADLALSCPPARKSGRAAVHLLLYGTSLLGVSLLATRFPAFQWLAALFSAAGHELMAQQGSRSQLRGTPYYVPPDRGVKILDVLPETVAAEMGLQSGDIIESVNGIPTGSREEFRQTLGDCSFFLEFVGRRGDGSPLQVEYRRYNGRLDGLGLILVPEQGDQGHVEIGHGSLLRGLWRIITERLQRR